MSARIVEPVVVSPDNKNVYVRQGDGLLVYDRNETTGLLTAKPGAAGCWTEVAIAGCTDSFGLTGNGFENQEYCNETLKPAAGPYAYRNTEM